ncbi:MAG: DoxX family protein [Gammaproteobacteria bacterium]|nr:DoxX family protein [Gammaproteobacteria bacterium]
MKIVHTIILALLVLLAMLSGATKIALMPQDVEFFGKYGFSNSMLFAFGASQLAGGVLMTLQKTRFYGAALVAITFLVSLVLLLMEGNIAVSAVTLVATLLLGVVMKQNRNVVAPDDPV